jgi:hypothetical protein
LSLALQFFPKNFKNSATGCAPLDPGEAHLVIEVAASRLGCDKGLTVWLYARHRVKEFKVIAGNRRVTCFTPAPAPADGACW